MPAPGQQPGGQQPGGHTPEGHQPSGQAPAGGAAARAGDTWGGTWSTSWGTSWNRARAFSRHGGGWVFAELYDVHWERHKEREEEGRKLEEHIRKLKKVDAEIARLLHKDELREQVEDRLKELGELVERSFTNRDLDAAREYSEKASRAYIRVVQQGNFSALQALEREMNRAREDEEFLLLALALLE